MSEAFEPYALLEVEPSASPGEIKSAYRRLARAWHPDRNREEGAAERFKQIARAWAVLGDPEQRRRFDLREGRSARGEFPEEFAEDLANAIDRADRWLREVVLPHYARFHRGSGAEFTARLWRDRNDLLAPRPLPRASWWKRRRIRRKTERVVVTVLSAPSRDATVLLRGRDFWEVAVIPSALWHGQIRTAEALDSTLIHLLLARYGQLLGDGRGLADRDDAIPIARALDDGLVRARQLRWALWGAVALGLIAMFTAGYNKW